MATTTKSDPPIEPLQNEWKHLYQILLPAAARSKSPSQPRWPIHNDHCFARIILDAKVGITTPWPNRLKSPAYKNMSAHQLKECIALGKKILNGEVDLMVLDEKSLALRGKETGKGRKRGAGAGEEGEVISRYFTKEKLGKRVRDEDGVGEPEVSSSTTTTSLIPHGKKQKLMADFTTSTTSIPTPANTDTKTEEDLTPYLQKIASSSETPFQKRVLALICQIPRGQYTTYGAISDHLSSSPRAVGNALRENPFAPHVPCHRILASGGGIGGFHGSWGRNGEKGLNDDKKRALLRGEGVRFDGQGRVVGGVWRGFV